MAAEPSMVARAESGAPPRARILKTARELFYRDGIHAVSVDAIAEAAGSNKTTLYRHFESKDELVAECLRELTRDFDLAWADIQRANRSNSCWPCSALVPSSRSAPTSAAAHSPTQQSNCRTPIILPGR